MAPILGYWNLRGLGQAIRLLMKYCEFEYEEKLYDFGSTPETMRDDWLKEKFNLGLDFPNLPYFIDGDLKLTQSRTILTYIGEKYGLCGKTPENKAVISMLLDEAIDSNAEFIRLAYSATDEADFNNKKIQYLNDIDTKIGKYEKYLSKNNGNWLGGDNICSADFLLYEVLDKILILEKSVLNKYPRLTALKNNFEKIPKIKEYLQSKEFIAWPLTGPSAKFGYHKSN